MRAVRIIILSCSLFFSQIIANGQSKKLTKEERKQGQRNIDSLLLVHSLPIRVSAKDSLFRMDLQTLLQDSLKARKFECLNYDDAGDVFKKYFTDLFAVNDKQRMRENIEKSKTDKDHYIREMENAQPQLQSIQISACGTESDTCIVIQRYNFPNATKKKSWEFKYEPSESINHFVSRIIESLISHPSGQ